MSQKNDNGIIRRARRIERSARAAGFPEEKVQEMVLNSIKAQILWEMTGHESGPYSEECIYDAEDFKKGHPDWMKEVRRKKRD